MGCALAVRGSRFESRQLHEVHLHGAGSWIALPPTATDLVLTQRWWTTPPEGELPLLPTQVVLDAPRSSGLGVG